MRRKTPVELRIESRRLKIAAMLLKGITIQSRIAKEIGVALPTIRKDLAAIRKQWRIEMVERFDAALEEQLLKLDRVEENAWRGWERSSRMSQKVIRKQLEGGKLEVSQVWEQRAGDAKFLEVVRKCIEDRRKMMGLDEPTRVDVRGQLTVAAATLQQTIETNGDYIQFRRDAILAGRPTISGILGDGDRAGQVETGQALDVVGRPVGANGNGKTPIAKPTLDGISDRAARGSNGAADNPSNN